LKEWRLRGGDPLFLKRGRRTVGYGESGLPDFIEASASAELSTSTPIAASDASNNADNIEIKRQKWCAPCPGLPAQLSN
jgi:hypothetical protein